MRAHEKFLEFNGKNIVFKEEEELGYLIAVKPICEALNVVYTGQVKRLKKHPIFGSALYKRTIQIPNDQPRAMTCIHEKYVYGWICSINSDNPDLIAYQKTCYDLLYNHFHGTITGRKDLLIERKKVDKEIADLKVELKKEDLKYKELKNLENKRKAISTKLNSIDKSITNQYEMEFEKENPKK